jgi:hypothetical protein
MPEEKTRSKKFRPYVFLVIMIISLVLLGFGIYYFYPALRGAVIVSAIASVISILVKGIYDSINKPYPTNRIDQSLRLTFKRYSIKGQNLIYFRKVSTNCEYRAEIMNFFNEDKTNGNFTKIKSEISKIFDIDEIDEKEEGASLKISGELHQKRGKDRKRIGTFEAKIIESKVDESMDLEENVNVEFTISFSEWTYKYVKDNLHDASETVNNIIQLIGGEYDCESANPIVKFETNSEPVILKYINEINKYDDKNSTLTIAAGKNLYINFFENKCEIDGAHSSSDFDTIVEAMSWYV